jgi:hypothetical protein
VRSTASVTVSKISHRRRLEDCSRKFGYGRSRCRHSDMPRRFSRSHNKRSTEPRQDCIALCSPWRCMAHSQSSYRMGPEVLLDPEAPLVLLALEVPVVRDHLSDQIGPARKPRDR